MLCWKGRVRTQKRVYQAEHYDHCTTRHCATLIDIYVPAELEYVPELQLVHTVTPADREKTLTTTMVQ
jgi:hypothetical protein